MWNLKTVIFVLTFTPFIVLSTQLTGRAQVSSPSLGTAESVSGGGATGSDNNPISAPSLGTAGSMSGGGSTGSNSAPSLGTAGSMSGGGSTGSDNITVIVSTNNLRELRNAIGELVSSGSDSLSPITFSSLRASLISDGVSPGHTDQLIVSFSKVLSQLGVPNTNFSANNLNPEKLVASTKIFKPTLTIAQDSLAEGEIALILDSNNLTEAINIYSKIVLESDDSTIIKLSRNRDFLTISRILKTLRSGII